MKEPSKILERGNRTPKNTKMKSQPLLRCITQDFSNGVPFGAVDLILKKLLEILERGDRTPKNEKIKFYLYYAVAVLIKTFPISIDVSFGVVDLKMKLAEILKRWVSEPPKIQKLYFGFHYAIASAGVELRTGWNYTPIFALKLKEKI